MARHAGKPPARSSARHGVAPVAGAQDARADVDPVSSMSDDERGRMIREGAYRRFEQRAFAHGHDLEDWLAAESEVDSMISERQRSEGVGSPDAELQQSGSRSILRAEKIERIVRQHPQRDAPKV